MKQYPSQARLRELFDYDPDGFLVWKSPPNGSRVKKGDFAGSKTFEKNGFRALVYISKYGYLHTIKLIWIFHFGEIPEKKYIKCRSGMYGSIKIEDLYITDKKSSTHCGVRVTSGNKTGFKGVRKQKNGTYQALSSLNNCLGTYLTAQAAASAYDEWALEYYGAGVSINESGCKNFEDLRIKHGSRNRKETLSISQYKGVYKNNKFPSRSKKQWRSSISIGGKMIYIGVFSDKEQAARAYNIAAREHYGEHAVLNDIPDPLGTGDIF